MNTLKPYANLLARILLALIFVLAGAGKIAQYGATQDYMNNMSVPGALLPLVILLELGGGLAIIIGFQTRAIAIALAGFSVVAAILFHGDVADKAQLIHVMKNLALAGGLLLLAIHGAGPFSLDNRGRSRE